MCGRYASSRPAEQLAEQLGAADDTEGALAPDYNVAPTKPVPAVLERDGRRLVLLRWGLVPSWAKDPKIGNRLINARVETVAEKSAFRAALARRRCLLPADGFYEWQPVAGRKQPFFITDPGGELLTFAGLYELWRDPESGEWLRTCTVLTTSAPDDLGRIHDRVPMLVSAPARDRWLSADEDAPLDALAPAVPGMLVARPVRTLVNDVRHNGPELLEPAALTPG